MIRFDSHPLRSDLRQHELDSKHNIYTGMLPSELLLPESKFEQLWNEHSQEPPKIKKFGKLVPMPRFQQAYEFDYLFSQPPSLAIPAPPLLRRYLNWIREYLDDRLNGLLVNWYDGPSHYIGPHSDKTKQLIPGSPIVTLSFGEPRVFRLSRGRGDDHRVYDLPTAQGLIILIPWETNLAWKHSIPKSTKYQGRRISVTARAFRTPLTE